MHRSTVILGADLLVGSHLAAQLLLRRQGDVYWTLGAGADTGADVRHFVETRLRGVVASREAVDALMTRLVAPIAMEQIAIAEPEAWVLNAPAMSSEVVRDAEGIREANLAAVLRLRPAAVNWVERGITASSVPDGWARRERVGSSPFRYFQTALLIDPASPTLGIPDDLARLLAPIDDVVGEIRGRLTEFFVLQPMRLAADGDRAVSLMTADETVTLMLATADRDETPGLPYVLQSSASVPLGVICNCVGDALDVALTPVGSIPSPNAVDRLLSDRLGAQHPLAADSASSVSAPHVPIGAEPPGIGIETVPALVRNALAHSRQRRAMRDEDARETSRKLERNAVTSSNGELTYFVAGRTGPPLVLINALGQGLDCWSRLVHLLAQHHRVFIWESRGLAAEAGDDAHRVRLADHVADIGAVLADQRIEDCCLIGWCTGPQVAVEFYRQSPAAVRGMVFLSCQFNIPNHPELSTAYRDNLDLLCRAVVRQPKHADAIMRTLGSVGRPDVEALRALDGDAMADAAVRLVSDDMRQHVVRPFRTAETTVRYAEQVVDLLSHDTLAHAPTVSAPVLVLGCEHDQVAPAARARAVASRFPRSRYVELTATHYALYEQPERVYGLIAGFVDELFGGDGPAASSSSPRVMAGV